ncbi:MAG: hypothetical protein ACYC5H_13005 [Methylovirgula sp.]
MSGRLPSCTARDAARRPSDRRLLRDGFVMRYDEVDDFAHPETAFLVCAFW